MIKTIRYPHMWRYRWFHWYKVCPINCTYIRWCIIETSSGLPRKSSAISGDLRKISENVRERSSGLRNNFGRSLEIFGKWSEIFGRSSKTSSAVCLYNKKNIIRYLEDINFMFSWHKQYPTRSLRSLVRCCSRHSNIKFISTRHHVISSIYLLN